MTTDQATHRLARLSVARAELEKRVQAARRAPLIRRAEMAEAALVAALDLLTEQQELNAIIVQTLREIRSNG